jgi:hypothetical protein
LDVDGAIMNMIMMWPSRGCRNFEPIIAAVDKGQT